jgi:hypothetical protein
MMPLGAPQPAQPSPGCNSCTQRYTAQAGSTPGGSASRGKQQQRTTWASSTSMITQVGCEWCGVLLDEWRVGSVCC